MLAHRRSSARLLVLLGGLAAALALAGWALADGSKGSSDGTAVAGNDIYDVAVEDVDCGIGAYTARTGDSHPVTIATGDNQNVIYGGAALSPWSSYNTIRSYTTETDYVNVCNLPSSSLDVVGLDDYATVEDLGTTGVRTTYVLPGPEGTPDELTIVQDVRVNGTTFEDSTIEVTTTVTNDGEEPVDIGIRYLWDMEMSADDGPTFTQVSPDGSPQIAEQSYAPPGFVAYRIEDNNEEDSPLFSIYGTATGPGTISPTPTTPEALKFASWPDSYEVAFDYATTPGLDIASETEYIDDSAVLYFFGPDAESAVTLDPGDSVTVSASLFAAEPGEPPPFIGTPQPTPARRRATATPTPTETPLPTETAEPEATATPEPPTPPPPSPTPFGGPGGVIIAPPTGSGGYLGTPASNGPPAAWLALALSAATLGATGAALRFAASRRRCR